VAGKSSRTKRGRKSKGGRAEVDKTDVPARDADASEETVLLSDLLGDSDLPFKGQHAPPPVDSPAAPQSTGTVTLASVVVPAPPTPFEPAPSGDQSHTALLTSSFEAEPALPFDEQRTASPPPRRRPLATHDTGTVSLVGRAAGAAALPFDQPANPLHQPRPPDPLGAPLVEPPAAAQPQERRVQVERSGGHPTTAGITLFNDTVLAADVYGWDLDPPRDCFTIVAKATADLVVDDVARLRSESDPLRDETEDPSQRALPPDRVPFKLRADVLLLGHAYPAEPDAREGVAALSIGAGEQVLERELLVFGDRFWQPALAGFEPSLPEPFYQVALDFSSAFGGPDFALNPLGIGLHESMRDAPGPLRLAQLEDPQHRIRTPRQRPAPACFAPIPLSWKQRWKGLGRQASPWTRFTEAFDWGLYQAAPRQLQRAWLRGDEPFVLQGVHRRFPVLSGSLPGLRVRGFAARSTLAAGEDQPGGGFEEIAMAVDTVVFEPDDAKLTLVYRGLLPVANERQHDIASIHLISEKLDQPPQPLSVVRAAIMRGASGSAA